MTEKSTNKCRGRRVVISERTKRFLCIACIFLFCSILFAQANNVVVWVMPTEGENLGGGEERWLPGEVQKSLRAIITNYSGLRVAEENADYLAQIQARSYNENISEEDAVRMGRMLGANYVIRSAVTKTDKFYSLNVIFQNLEKGQHYAESNKTASSTEVLYVIPGCAVNEAVIEICDILDTKGFGTGMSQYTKRILRNGANDLSDEEEKKLLDEEIKRRNSIIASINQELESNKFSTDTDAALAKAQLELQKNREQENLKQAQQKQERLAREAELRAEEERKQASRSSEQKKRISSAEQEIKEKIEELRKQKTEGSSVLNQIKQIEAMKKAILDIRGEEKNETTRIQQERDEELKRKKSEIMDAPLREAQKDSKGNMLPEIRQIREDNYKKEETKILDEYETNSKNLFVKYSKAEYEIWNLINNHYDILEKGKTADNIVTKDIRVEVGRYRGEKYAWPVSITLMSDGTELCTYSFEIEYETLSGKKPNLASDEYVDEVDLYSNLFSNVSAPLLQVSIVYTVTPAQSNEPSKYYINLAEVNIKNLSNDKAVSINAKAFTETKPLQMKPFYNVVGYSSSDSDFVRVSSGTFDMGGVGTGKSNDRRVTVSSFYICNHEVTQIEYAAIMESAPSHFQGNNLPVEQVSWYDAIEYCNKLSVLQKLTPCYSLNGDTDTSKWGAKHVTWYSVVCNFDANGYRLPTEAEWEYAARGGTYNSSYEYSGSNTIENVAWYSDNSGSQTHEVKKKTANALGLYDMSGNVDEWCWDWYEDGYGRVIRGGSWKFSASDCRVADRMFSPPEDTYYSIGFRVVRGIPEERISEEEKNRAEQEARFRESLERSSSQTIQTTTRFGEGVDISYVIGPFYSGFGLNLNIYYTLVTHFYIGGQLGCVLAEVDEQYNSSRSFNCLTGSLLCGVNCNISPLCLYAQCGFGFYDATAPDALSGFLFSFTSGVEYGTDFLICGVFYSFQSFAGSGFVDSCGISVRVNLF
ncbi:MAG: SUMF1/EgtB/PvdO family nonheme iron enzyme [Treponemataceae bacterium]|nr:SUMF1/EgtB/PvdO family nonheme iron enzyme [Treponemataceae bacterium]